MLTVNVNEVIHKLYHIIPYIFVNSTQLVTCYGNGESNRTQIVIDYYVIIYLNFVIYFKTIFN